MYTLFGNRAPIVPQFYLHAGGGMWTFSTIENSPVEVCGGDWRLRTNIVRTAKINAAQVAAFLFWRCGLSAIFFTGGSAPNPPRPSRPVSQRKSLRFYFAGADCRICIYWGTSPDPSCLRHGPLKRADVHSEKLEFSCYCSHCPKTWDKRRILGVFSLPLSHFWGR